MQDATGDSTLEANNAFERDFMTKNVVPKHSLLPELSHLLHPASGVPLPNVKHSLKKQ